jgi:hypothetical protein
VPTLDAAIELIHRNSYANGPATFTGCRHVARMFERGVHVTPRCPQGLRR